ncbi:MAG: ABC transporter ATP-binding protein [Nitrospiraceae bacterium]|nr:ABC transporter ATP-binding protein [Nitrospiraceae bacterium]
MTARPEVSGHGPDAGPLMAVIEVEGLGKSFEKGIFALKGVSFSLSRGQILGILGPNGAGKTTLIHLLLGLIIPTEGEIRVFGERLSPKTRGRILGRMNFASNYVSLPLALTLWENLMVYAHMYEVPSPRPKCAEVLRMFELYHLKDKHTKSLSSGQMMRLCLAKALINDPEILLLDEPTAGLDPEIARKTRHLLVELSRQRGLSVVYTSHNLWEMQEVSDRVLFLMAGEALLEGPWREVLGKYEAGSLEELFFKIIEGKRTPGPSRQGSKR